jgi:hypothetical protein
MLLEGGHMGGTYDIFEKLSDGKLLWIERAESLERAKMRFFALSSSSRHEYVVYDKTRGCKVGLKARAAAS